MRDISIVTVVENNVVKEIHAFKDVDNAERWFAKEVLNRGIIPEDSIIENGYCEFEGGETVCINSKLAVN